MGYLRTNRAGMGAAPPWVPPAGWKPRVVPIRYGMGAVKPVRYRRRRGFGQDDGVDTYIPPPASINVGPIPSPSDIASSSGFDLSSAIANIDQTFGFNPGGAVQPLPSTGLPSVVSQGSSFDWSSFLSNLTGNAAAVAKVAETPMTTYTLPNGTVVTTPAAASNSQLASFGGGFSGILPILGIGLVVLLFAGSGKH